MLANVLDDVTWFAFVMSVLLSFLLRYDCYEKKSIASQVHMLPIRDQRVNTWPRKRQSTAELGVGRNRRTTLVFPECYSCNYCQCSCQVLMNS